MNDKKIEERYAVEDSIVIPRFIWEDYNSSHERTVKRLIVALLITILLMVGTNMAWLYVFNQYDISSESYTVESDNDGNSNMLQAGMNGVINNGIEDRSETEDND